MSRIIRRRTKVVQIGKFSIGGNNPIAIQSMTKTKTADVERTVKQIKELELTGCEIVRLAVKDLQDAKAIRKIKDEVNSPIVADIHFNWRLAIDAIDNGIDKIRLNPGNIYKREEIREIAKAAKLNRIPIRVGVNSGSLRVRKFASSQVRNSQPDKMVKDALDYIKILEGFKFFDIVVSLKASNILDTIEAYRKMAKLCDYPFHLGVTATGLPLEGLIKSSIAQGALLLEGIGDTIRISLTDEPKKEVSVAKIILASLGFRSFGPEIISCPTCGRCEVDLLSMIKKLETALASWPVGQFNRQTGKPANRQTGKLIKVAVMGCVVNGPGEAKEADLGIAFGKNQGLLFRNGKAIKKLPFSDCINALLKEMEALNAL